MGKENCNGNGEGGETVKRVSYLFKKECEEIKDKVQQARKQKQMKEIRRLSDAQITQWIIQHNAFKALIKPEIIARGIYGEDYQKYI